MLISNKIYNINFDVCDEVIYIHSFSINPIYRNRGYSRRILYNIKYKYNKCIVLECWPTLLSLYKHLGFNENGNNSYDGYIEMILK